MHVYNDVMYPCRSEKNPFVCVNFPPIRNVYWFYFNVKKGEELFNTIFFVTMQHIELV